MFDRLMRTVGRQSDAMRDRPLFFGSHGQQLYGVFHPTRKPGVDRPVAVFCHSVGLEHMTSSRLEALGARAIDGMGLPAFRYHARGHGDSEGDYRDVTFHSLVEDAIAAADQARRLAGASSVIWVATRFGSLVAAEAMRRRSDAVALVLWEPVHRGRDFFRDTLRNLLFSQVAQNQRPNTTVEQSLLLLEREKCIELFGTYLHLTLYRSALEGDLEASLSAWNGPTLLVQIQKRQKLSPENARLKSAIERHDQRIVVEVLQIGDEPAWSMFPHPPYVSDDLIRETVGWVHGLVSS